MRIGRHYIRARLACTCLTMNSEFLQSIVAQALWERMNWRPGEELRASAFTHVRKMQMFECTYSHCVRDHEYTGSLG